MNTAAAASAGGSRATAGGWRSTSRSAASARAAGGEVWLAKNALGTYRAVKIIYRNRLNGRNHLR